MAEARAGKAPADAAALAMRAWREGEAASDPKRARTLLERANRMSPATSMVTLSLALACLRDADPETAARLFEQVAVHFDVAEAWLGLAASALQLSDPARAADAMQECLSRHTASATALLLANSVAQAAGRAGWCAIDAAGHLCAGGPADVLLDGVALQPKWRSGTCRLPPGSRLEVQRDGQPLLGSPIDLAALLATEGLVQAQAGGITGWAWHPAAPDRAPVLTIAGATTQYVTPRTLLTDTIALRPLARPRQFTIAAADLPPGMLRVCGPDGRDLLGSPIDPGMERRSATGAEASFMPVWADITGPACTAPPGSGPVDVVVPVYGGGAQTLACLDSVLVSLPPASRLHVVDDCSPGAPFVAALDALAQAGKIHLHRMARNSGFPAAANVGIQAACDRDVVLLNSDTLVPPGWLAALTAAARSAPGIATACPLSNEATILSYPSPKGGNPMPDLAGTVARARLAQQANGEAIVDIPVAVGFCMFISRACLDDIGALREDLFAQGYGEENDFCLRARHRGWRNVAVPGAFVAHAGGTSFGHAQAHLQARNAAVLNRLHPGYDALIAAWVARDPLGPYRRRMDQLRWRAGREPHSAVLVTHAGGGGVDRVLESRAAALQAAGSRPIVLRPEEGSVVVGEGDTPNLRYAMPKELDALARLLRAERPTHVELHHTLGHDSAILHLATRLGVPHEVYVHDYAWFCPRISLVPEHTYCGEPSIEACQACVADHGARIEETITVKALVERSSALLEGARQVVAPSADVATRMQRHFPTVRAVISPFGDDAAIAPPLLPRSIRHVCVVGGIGIEKGYDILLACVRDAARRELPLSFTLVGHSADDERLLDAGPIHITGYYRAAEVERLIAAQRADVAWLPSVCPETWCFALTHMWRAGLPAIAFDIGTPSQRIRSTGWGWVLPLGLQGPAINDWMLRLVPREQQGMRLAANRRGPHIHASPAGQNAVI